MRLTEGKGQAVPCSVVELGSACEIQSRALAPSSHGLLYFLDKSGQLTTVLARRWEVE